MAMAFTGTFTVHGMAGRAAAVVALAVAATGSSIVPAMATPTPEDPICNVLPHLERCMGGPLGAPDGPSDAGCAFDPADASCSASQLFGPSPGAIPNPIGGSGPPPIGSGLPGSMDTDGMPYGSPPMSSPSMGGMPGMPGSIP